MAVPIRVLIVDDSAFVRALLREALEAARGIEVVGEAANGVQAVEMAKSLQPGLITMDLEMPVMGGLEAIDAIMRSKAVPILVVSDVAHAENAMEALALGALEVMQKPDYGALKGGHFARRVRLLAGVSVVTRMRVRAALAEPAPSQPAAAVAAPPYCPYSPAAPHDAAPLRGPVFAIASSTGGTQALALILAALPSHFAGSVLIAQHISDGFSVGLAEWLARLCPLPVRVPAHGERVHMGQVLISPSEFHMSVKPDGTVDLAVAKPHDVYHPSCDVLLESVAQVFGVRSVGIILTGMGRDGAAGMGHIRKAGGVTIAQDEASSLIYGMNRVAVERGHVQHLVPLDQLASTMQRLTTERVW
jgi:two-component system, chemotaxis family, protein-glutamate methylesterase/glutaminase